MWLGLKSCKSDDIFFRPSLARCIPSSWDVALLVDEDLYMEACGSIFFGAKWTGEIDAYIIGCYASKTLIVVVVAMLLNGVMSNRHEMSR